MRSTSIYRGSLPVDGQWHEVTVPGQILSWGCRNPHTVDYWFYADMPGEVPQSGLLRVFGTGHPIPTDEHIRFHATLIVPGGELVWHVIERLRL